MKIKNPEVIRTIKFVLFSISAGVIQLGSTTILSLIWPVEKFNMGPVIFYLIGLILSVIWNLTFNRKFTFKSAANLPVAILKTIGFYVVFAPASTFLQAWLTNGEIFNLLTISHLGWHTIIGTIICMVINMATEFPFQRFVVFGKSIDTNVSKEPKEE